MAIIELARASKAEAVQYGLERLERAEPKVEGDIVFLDKWRCDLRRKTFVLGLIGSDGMFEMSGDFERGADGRWSARVKSTRQT